VYPIQNKGKQMTEIQKVRQKIINEYGIASFLLLQEVVNIVSSVDKNLAISNKINILNSTYKR